MNRTYTYGRRFNPLFLIFAFVMVVVPAMVAKAYFQEAFWTTSLLYRVVAGMVGLLFAAVSLFILVIGVVNFLGLRKVIVNEEYLTIQNPVSKTTIRWRDITEFGRCTEGLGPKVRVFYVKTKVCNDKKIHVCTNHLEHLKDLIDTIFTRAVNAKFVTIENLAWIPFTKQLQVFTWDRNDGSFI